MSERRRSLFVLLIVAALIGGSIHVVLTKPTKLGLDLQGGSSSSTRRSRPRQPTVDADAMQRSIDLMQERVNEFGVSEAEIYQSGRTRSRSTSRASTTPSGPPTRSAPPPSCSSTTGKRTSSTRSARPTRTRTRTPPAGRRAARGGRAGVQVHEVGIGKGLDPLDDDSPGGESQAGAEPRFYVFNKADKKPFDGGQTFGSRQDALESLRTTSAPTPRSSRSRPACSSCAPSGRPRTGRKPDRWWVIQDRPGLSGTDIRNPEQSFDHGVGNQPIVTFNFTDKGRKAFQAITRQVAQRGADNAFGGTRSRPRSTSRSRSTTSSSRRRTSTGGRTRTASTARPAPRSPARSRSSPRRTSRRCSRSAPCR